MKKPWDPGLFLMGMGSIKWLYSGIDSSILAEEKAAIRMREQPKKIFTVGISPKITAAKAIP